MLRLAVILHRARNPANRPQARVATDQSRIVLTLDAQWLADRPLARADLDAEVARLAKAGFELSVETFAGAEATG